MVSTPIEGMESGAHALHGFEALFFWDVRLRQDHVKTSFMSLEFGVMPLAWKKTRLLSSRYSMEILVLVLMQKLKA